MRIAIHNGASPTEKLRLDSSGNVGIGVTSSPEQLHVAHAGKCNIKSQCTASGSGANAAVQGTNVLMVVIISYKQDFQ